MKSLTCITALAPKAWALAAWTLGASNIASAVTVAVMDSGTDYKHKDLSNIFWRNLAEEENGEDDDANGLIDDIHGWNFAENNNQVIDYQYLNSFSPDCETYFQLQGKVIRGTATSDEKKWLAEKRQDQAFVKELMVFGNFVHGTHVAGISSVSRSIEKLMVLKVIPTKTPSFSAAGITAFIERADFEVNADTPNSSLMPILLDMLVTRQLRAIVAAGDYVATQKVDVVNGSFGVSYKSAKTLVERLLGMISLPASEGDIQKYTRMLIDKINETCKSFVDKAADTVFVFAAGNDGTDNNDMPMAPAGINADNVISVAATVDIETLASFSNYGGNTVDVAAPGVSINSTIPGDKHLEMSGTSMAAPYVTQVVALVRDVNPTLKASEVRQIVVGTVDTKSWLAGKVKSSGIVNPKRALKAAKLAASQDVETAIRDARSTVTDLASTKRMAPAIDTDELILAPLPSLFP